MKMLCSFNVQNVINVLMSSFCKHYGMLLFIHFLSRKSLEWFLKDHVIMSPCSQDKMWTKCPHKDG